MKIQAVLFTLSLLAGPALAADEPAVATLGAQEGTILVNSGEVFETAADNQALKAGDRVMVMEGGKVNLVFADGCPLVLESGSLFLVPEVSTCAGTVADVQRIGPTYAQVYGGDTHEEDVNEWLILIGSVTVAAILLADDDNDPVSP